MSNKSPSNKVIRRMFDKRVKRSFYKTIKVPKSNGTKYRKISMPSKATREFQECFYAYHKTIASSANKLLKTRCEKPFLLYNLSHELALLPSDRSNSYYIPNVDFSRISANLGNLLNISEKIFPKALVGGMPGRHISEIAKLAYGSKAIFKSDISKFYSSVRLPALKASMLYAAKKIVTGLISEVIFAPKCGLGRKIMPPAIDKYKPDSVKITPSVEPLSFTNNSIYGALGVWQNMSNVINSFVSTIMLSAARFNGVVKLLDSQIDVKDSFEALLSAIMASEHGILDSDGYVISNINDQTISQEGQQLLRDIMFDLIIAINNIAIPIITGFVFAESKREDVFFNLSPHYPLSRGWSHSTPHRRKIAMVNTKIDQETISYVESYMFVKGKRPQSWDKEADDHISPACRPSRLLDRQLAGFETLSQDASTRAWESGEFHCPIVAMQGNNYEAAMSPNLHYRHSDIEHHIQIQSGSSEGTFPPMHVWSDNAKFIKQLDLRPIFEKIKTGDTSNMSVLLEQDPTKLLRIENYVAVSDTATLTEAFPSGTISKVSYNNPCLEMNINPIRNSSLRHYNRVMNEYIGGLFLDSKYDRSVFTEISNSFSYAVPAAERDRFYAKTVMTEEALLAGIETNAAAIRVNVQGSPRCHLSRYSMPYTKSNAAMIYDQATGKLTPAIMAPATAGYAAALATLVSDTQKANAFTEQAVYHISLVKLIEQQAGGNNSNEYGQSLVFAKFLSRGDDLDAEFILLPYLGQMLKIAITPEMKASNKISFVDVIKNGSYEIITDNKSTSWHTEQVNDAVAAAYELSLDYYLTADGALPEGGITSPLLGNYVMAEIVDEIQDDISALGGLLRIYVDDITVVFPYELPGEARKKISSILSKALAKKGLKLSRDKTNLIRGNNKREVFRINVLKYPGSEADTTIRLRRCDHADLRQTVHNAAKFTQAYLQNLITNRTLVPTPEYIAEHYPEEYTKRSHLLFPRIINKINGRLAWAISISPARYKKMREKFQTEVIEVAEGKIYPLINEISSGFIDMGSNKSKEAMDEIASMD